MTDTTEIAKAPNKGAVQAGLRAGARVAGLIPRSIEDAWRLATAIAKSSLAPKEMKTPEQIMVAIMGGAEVGLPPFQALQSFAVINGRPTMWGDGVLAVVLAHGVKVKEWREGEGDNMIAKCEVTRPNEDPVEREFSVADAKTARLWGKDGPWMTYPKRMLQMRARSWAIRDSCADLLRGIQIREEVVDYDVVDSSVPAPSQHLALESQVEDGVIEIVDEDGVVTEVTEPEVVEVKPQPSGLTPTAKWAAEMREAFASARDPHDLPGLTTRWASPANAKALAKARRDDPTLAGAVAGEYAALLGELGG